MQELSIVQRLERIEQLLTSQTVLQKPTLNIDEVALYTGLKKAYIYKLTHKHEIPFYKPNGKNVVFKRDEIDSWLLRNRTATIEEIEEETANFVVNGNQLNSNVSK